MARALECPACGARHRLDSLSGGSTFRCDRCGQVLKVPSSVDAARAPSGERAAPPRSGARQQASPAPPPRRGGSAASRGQTVTATAGATAAVAAEPPTNPAPRSRSTRGPAAPRAPRRNVRPIWRVVAWLVAVPLGFLVTAWPAFQLGWIKKDDLLDVFVGEGIGRYVRLLVGAAIWALVTALLVQLFVEGGRWYMTRRRERQAREERGDLDARDDPNRGANRRRAPQPVAGSAPRPPAGQPPGRQQPPERRPPERTAESA
jgi:hypothetical protein